MQRPTKRRSHLQKLGIPVFPWPSKSSNLKPKENILWYEFERRLQAHQIMLNNVAELRQPLLVPRIWIKFGCNRCYCQPQPHCLHWSFDKDLLIKQDNQSLKDSFNNLMRSSDFSFILEIKCEIGIKWYI